MIKFLAPALLILFSSSLSADDAQANIFSVTASAKLICDEDYSLTFVIKNISGKDEKLFMDDLVAEAFGIDLYRNNSRLKLMRFYSMGHHFFQTTPLKAGEEHSIKINLFEAIPDMKSQLSNNTLKLKWSNNLRTSHYPDINQINHQHFSFGVCTSDSVVKYMQCIDKNYPSKDYSFKGELALNKIEDNSTLKCNAL